jgi:hypothetical protein
LTSFQKLSFLALFYGGTTAMSELLVIFLVGAAVAFVADRAVFTRGRLSGIKEAVDAIMRGAASHYQDDNKTSEPILNAFNEIKERISKNRSPRMGEDSVSAGLSKLGRAMGDVVFGKGFEAGRDAQARLETPISGKVRVDLSISELMQIRWLAHFGFEHTMWNTWDPEGAKPRPHVDVVFKNQTDAQRATESIDLLEQRIPKDRRDSGAPYALALNRQQMIRERWHSQAAQ